VIALNGPTQGLALKYGIYQEALEMYGKHENVGLIIEQEDLLKTQIENRDNPLNFPPSSVNSYKSNTILLIFSITKIFH